MLGLMLGTALQNLGSILGLAAGWTGTLILGSEPIQESVTNMKEIRVMQDQFDKSIHGTMLMVGLYVSNT